MATPAARSLIRSGGSGAPSAKLLRLAVVVALAGASSLEAQTLYKYRDASGFWVYSDRWPEIAAVVRPGEPAADAARVRLGERVGADGGVTLIAINELEAWAQIAFRVETSRNLDPDARSNGNALLPPRSETRLMALATMDSDEPAEGSFSYDYIIGHPGARHRPDLPYRLPYALADAHRVSQAYPDTLTHSAAANRHAIDFEMPVGTRVCAARAGLVIEIAGDFVDTGQDAEGPRDRANFVRVLHDDGTLALYGHLAAGSIRVAPGQRIGRGEHIADSGNTGYSTGPHLHFVVQRNRAGALESVPVRFAGAGGISFTPETGDVPVAY